MENQISSKKELLERIKDIQAVEIIARDSYEKDAKLFTNIFIVNTISSIKDDEDHHIFLLGEMIELLSKY